MTKVTTRPRATPARAKRRRDWKPAFLKALRDQGTVTAACEAAKISRQTAYRERQANEDFALQWHDVEHQVTDELESKAVEIALSGDTRMLEFLLKARRPERYRENIKVEHAGSVKHDLAALSTAELEQLAAGLDAKRTAAPGDG